MGVPGFDRKFEIKVALCPEKDIKLFKNIIANQNLAFAVA